MAVSQDGTQITLMTAASDAITDQRFLMYLRWVGATAAGHSLIVKDTGGRVLWESVADGEYFVDLQPIFQIRDGVVVDTMSSGKLYVYYR